MALGVFTDATNTQDSRVLTWNCGTLAVGDIIVVTMLTEDSTLAMQAPVATGVTFTQRVLDATASHMWAAVYTGLVTGAGSKSVTSTKSGAWTLKMHAGVALTCPTADGYSLAGSPVTTDTRGTLLPSAAVTCTANSLICALNGDWAAVDGASRTYLGTTTEDAYVFGAIPGTMYFWHQTAASGSNTIGLSAPTGQTWTLAGVEVLKSGGAPAAATVEPIYNVPPVALHHSTTW